MHLAQETLTKSKLTSKELKEKWRLAFAADLSEEKRTEIYFEDFLWHAFSYEELKCILV